MKIKKEKAHAGENGVGVSDRSPVGGTDGSGSRSRRKLLRTGGSGDASGTPVPAVTPAVETSWWAEDGDREKALEMLFGGISKRKIAKALGRHMETVIAWSRHPDFKARLSERLGDHVQVVKIRRLRQTSKFVDFAAQRIEKAQERVIAYPGDEDQDRILLRWEDRFHSWRREERTEMGEDVKRSQVAVVGGLDLHQTSSHEVTFKAFLGAQITAGAIRPEGLDGTDRGLLVAGVLQQALEASPEVMEGLAEEDRRAEEQMGKGKK